MLVFGTDSLPIMFMIGIIRTCTSFILCFMPAGVLHHLLGFHLYLILDGYALEPYLQKKNSTVQNIPPLCSLIIFIKLVEFDAILNDIPLAVHLFLTACILCVFFISAY